MSKYHLRKLTFHNPYLGTIEDYFSYSSDIYEWKNVNAVCKWASRTNNLGIAQKVLSASPFCLTVDVVIADLNEVEAKAAKRTAIAMARQAGNVIVNKR